MRNSVAVIILSGIILVCVSFSEAPAVDSPVFKSSGVENLAAGRQVAAFESLPTLDSILQRYVEALGGKEAIDRMRTRRLSGELIHDFPGENPSKTVLPAEVIAAAPNKWRLVLKTSTGIQQLGFDGAYGWTQDADRVLIDNRQARSKLAYLFNPQGAIRLEDYFSQLSLEGKVVSEGRAEYAVKARGSGGTQETLFFDADSGLLNRLGDNIVVKSYRRILGILHPVHIVITRKGGTSTYRFDDVAVNIAIEDARFAIPDLGEVFPDVFEGLTDPEIVPLLKVFPSVHEDMNVPCRDGRFLHDLIVQNGYKRGLEIGSFTGYSGLWMGLALKKTGGTLVTIEYEASSGEEARKNILLAGLEAVIDARIADAFAEIPKIEDEFDFVFIDAGKPDYVKFLNLIRDRVVAGGAIIAHNVTNYARDMQDFLAAVQNDPGLETTFQELSDEGMSVSRVRGPKSPPPGDQRTSDEQNNGRMRCRPAPDFDTLRKEILDLHQKTIDAHLKKDVGFFTKDISADYFSVGNGEIRKSTKEEIASQFERYLHGTTFTEYRNLREPIIGFSKDGSMAWSLVQVRVAGRSRIESGAERDFDVTWAWITLYERQGDGWVRLGEVSNFK
jgi:predicted O-methyltransferase YrrM